MPSRILLFLCSLSLTACTQTSGPSTPYAFVGTWDCGVDTFTFTNTTYTTSGGRRPIRAVTRDGRDYTLRFGNGDVIALAAVTKTGLTWVSGQTGDQFHCRRV